MSGDINDRLARLLRAVTLEEIKPMHLQSDALGAMPPPGSELKLEWKQAFAEGDPLAPTPDTKVFRPRYEFVVGYGDTTIFKQTSVFIIVFRLVDAVAFDELWLNEDLRKVFMEKQIQKTLWPLFRQHAHDGMSRLGMTPVPLPWLM